MNNAVAVSVVDEEYLQEFIGLYKNDDQNHHASQQEMSDDGRYGRFILRKKTRAD